MTPARGGLLLWALALLACPRTQAPPPPRRPDAAPSSPEPSLAALLAEAADAESPDARAPLPEERNPTLAGPLAACRARLQRAVPPELSGALAALEYEGFEDDACRLDLAVRMNEPALCEPLRLSALRQRCQWRAAVLSGQPERCPASLFERGRDPLCVTLTSRAAGLCGSVAAGERPLCLALVHHSATDCEALDPVARGRCRSEVALLSERLPAIAHRTPLGPGTVELELRPEGADASAPALERYSLDLAARGAFLDPAGVLYLVDPARGWPAPVAFDPMRRRPVLGLALPMPERAGSGGVEDLRVVMPDGRLLEAPLAGPLGEVRWEHLARTRAARVQGVARLHVRSAAAALELTVRFDTFVRDLVDARALRDAPEADADAGAAR